MDRLICRKRLIIMHAKRRESDSGAPSNASLIRIAAGDTVPDVARAVAAMREAGEPVNLVGERFARGDELIGWQVGQSTASFSSDALELRRKLQ